MKKEIDANCVTTPHTPDCYADEDFIRYLRDMMSEQDVASFESHCESCDFCAAALWRQKKTDFDMNVSDGDKELYNRFLEKTRKLLKQQDKPKDKFTPSDFK